MAVGQEDSAIALGLVTRAADMFERMGDEASADRLRHTAAIVGHDAATSMRPGLGRPLALMRRALALLDRDGLRLSQMAIDLQSAIDAGRDERDVTDVWNVDLGLLAPRLREPRCDPSMAPTKDD